MSKILNPVIYHLPLIYIVRFKIKYMPCIGVHKTYDEVISNQKKKSGTPRHFHLRLSDWMKDFPVASSPIR